jgi:hypothetical protein
MVEEAQNTEVVEEEVAAVVEDKAVEKAAAEKPAAEKDAASEEGDKKTKTLLSDDEGDGEGEVDPSKYEFTAPEGFEFTEETQTRLDNFKDAAAKLKLSQDQFQGIIAHNFESGQQFAEAQATAYVERIKQWGETVKADKEFGGENLKANLGAIKKVTDAYADESFNALVGMPTPDNPEGLGLGNHPAFLRFLHRVSKSLTDAEIIEGTEASPSSDQAGLKRLYPTMFSQAS